METTCLGMHHDVHILFNILFSFSCCSCCSCCCDCCGLPNGGLPVTATVWKDAPQAATTKQFRSASTLRGTRTFSLPPWPKPPRLEPSNKFRLCHMFCFLNVCVFKYIYIFLVWCRIAWLKCICCYCALPNSVFAIISPSVEIAQPLIMQHNENGINN